MMKLQILGILSACLLLFSCSKEEAANPNEVKHQVKFTVSPFSQEITDISYAKALSSSIGYLEYIVFNSSGTKVNQVSQASTDQNFGTFADQLSADTYTIYFVGTKQKTNHISTSLSDGCSVYYDLTQMPIYDSFYKKLTLTVGKDNITQDVVLDRFVSYLEVVLTDAMPTYVKKVVVNIENESSNFSLSTGDASSGANNTNFEKVTATTDAGKTGFTLGNFILNTKDPLTVNIRAYDVDNKIIAEKKVTNVTCVKNKKTILTGKLFGGTTPSSASFTVSVNDAFLEPATITF